MHPLEEPVYRAKGGAGEIVPVREGDVIDLGGRPLRIFDLPGHTPGSIAILGTHSPLYRIRKSNSIPESF